MSRSRSSLIIWLFPITLLGCSDQHPSAKTTRAELGAANMIPPAPEAMPQPPSEPPGAAKNPTLANRKIIYTANVDLVTEDLTKLERTLIQLVNDRKAYVADSDRSGSAGSTRYGNWKVRVPVEEYDAFLKESSKLGELVSVKANSQDVSEEFYDLEAREKAKKIEEDRLLKHLTESTGKLEEILSVERELTRVRTEIEQMQGRLRVLANLTTLATVTISAREIQNYVPPQAPTLSTKVSRTFFESLGSLRRVGELILLATVAIVPWLPLILLGLVILTWVYRRLVASGRQAMAQISRNPR